MYKKKQYTNRESYSLNIYLEMIGRIDLLSHEHEIELAKVIKKGGRDSDRALERLIKANLPFVVSIAKQYQNQGIYLEDLISEGNIGLIKAAKRFDETRGFKFISYAVWWIRQSILQALAEQSRIVRLPLKLFKKLNKIGKKYSELEQQLEREPTIAELAEELDLSNSEVVKTIEKYGLYLPIDKLYNDAEDNISSLDAPFSDDEDNHYLDLLPNEQIPPPDKKSKNILSKEIIEQSDNKKTTLNFYSNTVIIESFRRKILHILNTFTDAEAKIIHLHFGLNYSNQVSINNISCKFSISVNDIELCIKKIIRNLSKINFNLPNTTIPVEKIREYVSNMHKKQLLSEQEIFNMLLSIQNKKDDSQLALKKITESSMRFIVSTVQKYNCNFIPFEELIYEAVIAFTKAVKSFNENTNVSFISYAIINVDKHLKRVISDELNIIVTLLNRISILNYIIKKYDELYSSLGREPNQDEIELSIDIPLSREQWDLISLLLTKQSLIYGLYNNYTRIKLNINKEPTSEEIVKSLYC